MTFTLGALLALSFLISVLGLFVFIWAQTKGLLEAGPRAAEVIFAPNEVGTIEDPSGSDTSRLALQSTRDVARAPPTSAAQYPKRLDPAELEARRGADRSTRAAAFAFLSSAVLWLVLGSIFGLVTSLKFQAPDWLTGSALLSFGRLRPVHLNLMIYGWASMAGIGVALWMLPRLLMTALVGGRYAVAGAVLWNLGVASGAIAIVLGWTDGMEWLEIPWQIGGLLVIGGALAAVPLLLTLRDRKVDHLYVSVWYLAAALLWFPILYLVAKVPYVHFGVEAAIVNWWFAHNVLGLWLTPLGLAAAYYFIAKVLGRPIYSYNLSLIGFWALAMFYSQVGIHHLIGGPVPNWLVTVSIVQSVMMIVPVFAVAINQHMTVLGHFAALKHSPTLRFVVLGAMLYTLVSLQGTLEALRYFNRVVHFTQYTVAHAHLGVYGFFSMVMFGAIYFVMPRITEREWPHPRLIALHFWLVAIGLGVYFISLTVGGLLQGSAMLDSARPFIDSVTVTLPYLTARSVGGTLMTLGHFVFAYHFFALVLAHSSQRAGAALIGRPQTSGA
jgi:cytochrome c oxidase cbb3-type subunit 1